MERLSQNELLKYLNDMRKLWQMERLPLIDYQPKEEEQGYQQIKELILREDMVQQYRDEKEAEQAETELTYIEIVLDLYERIADLCKQLEAKKRVT